MEKLLIIIAILAIAGATWAGGLLVGPIGNTGAYECGPTISPGCPSDHVYIIQKEKSCRWEVFPVSQGPDFTSKLPEGAEVITIIQHDHNFATIWLKRRVCE